MSDEYEGDESTLDRFEADLVDADERRPRCRFCGQALYGYSSIEAGECERCARIGAAIDAAKRLPAPWYERRRA